MITFSRKWKSYLQVYVFGAFRLKRVLSKLKKAYRDIPTYTLSKAYREKVGVDNPDLIYGELSTRSFIYLLKLLPKSKDCKIVDLGCGDGKLVLAAGLYYNDIKAKGIEIVPDLAQAGLKALGLCQKSLGKKNSTVTILEKSFLSEDFTDACVVYFSGSAFSQETWNKMLQYMNPLPNDTFLISVARKVENPEFQLIYSAYHPVSWGQAIVYIYRKHTK